MCRNYVSTHAASNHGRACNFYLVAPPSSRFGLTATSETHRNLVAVLPPAPLFGAPWSPGHGPVVVPMSPCSCSLTTLAAASEEVWLAVPVVAHLRASYRHHRAVKVRGWLRPALGSTGRAGAGSLLNLLARAALRPSSRAQGGRRRGNFRCHVRLWRRPTRPVAALRLPPPPS